jgi:RNA polymerase sigma factor (sigma-70 family)
MGVWEEEFTLRVSHSFRLGRRPGVTAFSSAAMAFDRKTLLSDPKLLAALGAHVRSRVPAADADDVVQSVIADALVAASAPDEEEAMRRWLFGVAKNKIADFYRRTKRERVGDVDDAPASDHESAKDLLRWAQKELPPDSDAKRTFEWMLREGEGEKLEAIATSEKLPAPRVRQRVSRLRRHFRARWAAYAAALAAAGVAILVFYMLRRKPVPEARLVPDQPSATHSVVPTPPPVDQKLELAKRQRTDALAQCDAKSWTRCIELLDEAAANDPTGEADPHVIAARAAAAKALTPPPAPIPTPTFAPTSVAPTAPIPTSSSMAPRPRSTMSTPPSGGSL